MNLSWFRREDEDAPNFGGRELGGGEETVSEPTRWIDREETEATRPMILDGGEQLGPGEARRFGGWEIAEHGR